MAENLVITNDADTVIGASDEFRNRLYQLVTEYVESPDDAHDALIALLDSVSELERYIEKNSD